MVNLVRLNSEIDNSGIKKRYIADRLGIKNVTLLRKLSGWNEFKASEIEKLSDLLNLSEKARNEIFFAKNVEQQAT